MPKASMHHVYLDGSPFYAGLVDRYGRTVSVQVAEKVASSHGFTLRELAEADHHAKVKSGRVSCLGLVMALGY